LHQRLGLSREPHSAEALRALGLHLAVLTNEARDGTPLNEEGIFTLKDGNSDVFMRAPMAFDSFVEDFGILDGTYGRPKAVLASRWMTHTGITGIYSPFTGEANVNVHAPAATVMFTTLHEKAHQRGIAREDEAHVIAFLTAVRHPDADFRYAGYLNALNYVRSALSRTARPYLQEVNDALSDGVRRDINYSATFWAAYQGRAREIANNVNNNYLQFQGVAEGVQSYGLVVDLLLAYYEDVLFNSPQN